MYNKDAKQLSNLDKIDSNAREYTFSHMSKFLYEELERVRNIAEDQKNTISKLSQELTDMKKRLNEYEDNIKEDKMKAISNEEIFERLVTVWNEYWKHISGNTYYPDYHISKYIEDLNDYRNLHYADTSTTEEYVIANMINDMLPFIVEHLPREVYNKL